MLLKMFEFEIETVSYRMYLVMKIKETNLVFYERLGIMLLLL